MTTERPTQASLIARTRNELERRYDDCVDAARELNRIGRRMVQIDPGDETTWNALSGVTVDPDRLDRAIERYRDAQDHLTLGLALAGYDQADIAAFVDEAVAASKASHERHVAHMNRCRTT